MDKRVEVLIETVKNAGREILQLQKTDLSVANKSNNDIVTKADLLANNILKTQLGERFPDYGWLSEESVDDQSRLSCKHVWVVDPIDGTREYAAKMPEYAVSIALIENGIPVLAAVFNPATDELFYASKGEGAWLGEKKLNCNHDSSTENLLLLASRSEYKRGEWSEFEKKNQVKQIGSIAYKLALIAAGKADATFSLGPKNEWDIAAGVLLVSEAGGIVTNKKGKQIMFNQCNVLVDGIVATTPEAKEKVFSLINL